MKKTSVMIAAAAMTGLLAGTSSHAFASSASGVSIGKISKATSSSFIVNKGMKAVDDAAGKHDCKGKNDCKGQGGCKGDGSDCKGKNDCKGKGGCKTNA
jgi:ABC-type sugar transport system substrate-binding protein